MDLGVELFADAADLVLGDALDAQRFGEVVDRPGRDAVDVGLLDHREQRPLMPAPRLEQAREVAARPQLGDVELDGADPGVSFPLSVPVAMGIRVSVRSCGPAPTSSVTSASISSCASSRTPSRRNFGSAPCSDLLSMSNSVILRFAIVVVLHVVLEHRHLEPHGGLFVKGLLDLHHYSRHDCGGTREDTRYAGLGTVVARERKF